MSQRTWTKAELVERLAEKAGVSQSDANAMVNALPSVVADALSQGDAVSLPRIGKLSSRERSARKMRNPKTGESIHKEADRAPKMTFAKAIKIACNS